MAFQLPLIFTTLQPLLIIASNVLTLAIGPQRRVLQFAFSVPVLFLFAAQSLYRDWDRGWGLHYGLNCFVVTNLFVWFDWVVLNSPYREGWIKLDQRKSSEVPRDESTGSSPERAAFPKDDGGVVQSKSAVQKQRHGVPETFWGRLCWAARLSTTNRYIGWSCEVKNAPSSVPSTYPRWKFLVRKSLRFALFYALKDAMYSYTAASPHGTWLDLHPSVPVIGFDASPFRDRLYWTWVYIALTYVSLELMCTLYSLISVAAFMASPSECPRMFNDLSECYSMRRAWSVVWHQQMRRVCSAPGIWAARDALKLTRGSFSSKYTQLFVGFAVSGVIHASAAMLCHGSLEDDAAMRVFMYQAIIIFVEDHVIEFGKRCGFEDSKFWRVLGFVWTALALGTSLQSWTGKSLGHGLWVHDRESDFFGLGPK